MEKSIVLMMPLRKNVPLPKSPDWKITICLGCGQECWDRPLPDGVSREMVAGKYCSECTLKKSSGNR